MLYVTFDSKWICPKCVYLELVVESVVYPEGKAMSQLSAVEMESIFYYDYCLRTLLMPVHFAFFA